MEKIKCSVPILTLNSEEFLERCLESLKEFEDVFLLDGNSTDRTLEIAKRYGVPVYRQVETEQKNVKIKNFTEIREKARAMTKCDWVLQVDSDEFLAKELPREIRVAIEKSSSHIAAYNIQKKYCIGNQKFDFAFNCPNYYLRLYNKKSGIKLKPGKIVHEQMYIPKNLNITNLTHCVYSEVSPTYRACVRKDTYQLGLMKKTTFAFGSFKNRLHSLKMSLLYFLRAVNIFYKSIKVYLKHGYKNSLPIGQVMRHVRVHLIMSYWRLTQSLLGKKSIVYDRKTS